jgi:hypothetical protein
MLFRTDKAILAKIDILYDINVSNACFLSIALPFLYLFISSFSKVGDICDLPFAIL